MNSALLGLVAALAWGVHDYLGRFTTRSVGANPTMAVVLLSGLALLTLWMIAAGGWPELTFASLLKVSVSGVGYGLALLLLFAALRVGPLSLVSLIVGAYPASAVVFAVLSGNVPSALAWAGIATVMIGMALLLGMADAPPPDAEHEQRGKAAILAFLSHLCFAVSITVGQQVSPVLGEVETTWLTRIAGLVVLAGILFKQPLAPPGIVKWAPALVAMGALDILALGSILAAGGLPQPELAPVVSSGYGAVATLLGYFLLKERINAPQWLGIAMTICGTAVLSWAP
jgi:drug/metabolite transporter (DMT)-like permease